MNNIIKMEELNKLYMDVALKAFQRLTQKFLKFIK
jgi:hypothetical protein